MADEIVKNGNYFIGEIKEFPHDDRIWRLDYFGYIERGNVFSDPKIYVSLSPVKDESISRFYSGAVETIKGNNPIPIGIGLLPVLHLGSLWKNGIMVSPLLKDQAHFKDMSIDISPENVSIVKVKDIMSKGGYNFNRFRGSYCATVKVGNNPIALIIPCTELFRFYFATSQALTQKIIFGEVNKMCRFKENENEINDIVMFIDQMTKELRTKIVDNRLFVTLRKSLPDSDAWTVSRLLGNKIARQEACNVHNTISSASTENRGLYIKMGFPFDGFTELSVQGKQIKTDNEQFGFLALRLLKCTKSFPFETVIVDREIKKGLGSKEQGNSELYWTKKEAEESKKGSSLITSSVEASVEIDNRRIILPEERFSFLIGKELIKKEKEVSQFRNMKGEKITVEVESQSTSKGEYNGSNVQPIKIEINKKETKEIIAPYFEQIMLAIEYLEKNYGVRWRVCSLDNLLYSRYKSLSTFEINGRRKSNSWIYIKENQIRKFLLIEVRIYGRYIYILELERESNNYGIYFLNRMNEYCSKAELGDLKDLMKKWGEKTVNRSNEVLKGKGWNKNSIRHEKNESIENLARRMRVFLKSNFNLVLKPYR